MGLELVGAPQELWRFGTQERVQRGTPLMLFAVFAANAVAVGYSTPRLQGAAAGYSVTAGRTLILTRVLLRTSLVSKPFGVGYSDSDRGMDNAADGANPVNLDTITAAGEGVITMAVLDTPADFSTYYEIPAGKFPRLVTPVTAAAAYFVQLFGHEV